jgi:hypothetical protein
MRMNEIRPHFGEFIPEHLAEGVLYISERYRTCSHKCCCGCGEEVVTPLSPSEWKLTREGDLVSLWPSVGNWEYACRSHYVIRRNRVRWAGPMTAKQVANVQRRDAADLARMVEQCNAAKDKETLPVPRHAPQPPAPPARTEVEARPTRRRKQGLLSWLWGDDK